MMEVWKIIWDMVEDILLFGVWGFLFYWLLGLLQEPGPGRKAGWRGLMICILPILLWRGLLRCTSKKQQYDPHQWDQPADPLCVREPFV